VAVEVVRTGQGIEHARRQRFALLERFDRRLQNDELVAAEARDHVGVADRVLQPFGDGFEQHVTAGVAERIVDLLELVEIDEVNGAHVVGAPFVERALHAVAQHHAVGQPGQGIEARQMIDLGLGDLALGDVLDQHHHAAVLHRLDGEFERAPVHQVQGEGGIVAAGKPRVEVIDHAARRSPTAVRP
jgi:hypothetical protein